VEHSGGKRSTPRVRKNDTLTYCQLLICGDFDRKWLNGFHF